MPKAWRTGLAIASAIILLVVISPLFYIAYAIAREPGDAIAAALRADVAALTVRSIALAVAVTLSSLVVALGLAWLVSRCELPGGRRWLVPLSMPLAAPSFLVGEAYRRSLGLDGFAGAWLALTLISYPYALLPLEAALRRASRETELAARSLGLSAFGAFRRSTIPQLLPTLEWTGLLIALYALSDYGCVAMLRVRVLTVAIESRRAAFDPAGAAALSGVLSVLACVCLVGVGRLRGSTGAGASDAHAEAKCEPAPLGAWRWPAAALCAAVVLVAAGMPALMSGVWWAKGLRAGSETVASSLSPTVLPGLRTLGVSLGGAMLAAGAAVPIALLIHRGEYVHARGTKRASATAWANRLSGMALVGYGLPGVVVGFALVRIAVTTELGRDALYQSLALLLLGYVIKCVAEALGPTTASARRLHTDRLDAAIGMGAGFTGAWARVGWPAIAPGVAAGATLVFLTIVKELPITMILRPTGFDTLAFELFDLLNEARHTLAAPMALVMLGISCAVVWWSVGSRRAPGE